MAYLGKVKPTETTSSVLRSTYTGDGSTTTFNLPGPVANEISIIATINGVTQQDTAYTTNGSQIIFASAPASGDAIELRTISDVGLSYAPSAGSVTTGILADGAVTGAKIANAAVSDALIAGVSASKVSGTLVRGNMPAGSVIQVVYATPSTLTTSSTATGTSAPEWGNVTITPTASGNKLLCFLTGQAAYNSATQGESNSYLTASASGVAEAVFAQGVIGDETTSGRPKQHIAVHGQVTTSTVNTYTIRARVNGKNISGSGISVDWAYGKLTVMEIAA